MLTREQCKTPKHISVKQEVEKADLDFGFVPFSHSIGVAPGMPISVGERLKSQPAGPTFYSLCSAVNSSLNETCSQWLSYTRALILLRQTILAFAV